MAALRILIDILKSNRPSDWPHYLSSAVVWQVRKRLGHRFETQLRDGAIIHVYPSSAYSSIFYTRHPEGADLAFIRRHSCLADTFVDVGANVGIFSASLFDKFKSFICFEPAPSSFKALSETFALNPRVSCELHNIGVGDTRGELHFLVENDFSSTNRFVTEPGARTRTIVVDTLDSVFAERNQNSLVMKIDVEGFEERVFRGADSLFRKNLVKLVMFERLGRTNLDNVLTFLESRGYTVFRVLDDLRTTTDRTLVSEPLINLFACPSSIYPSLNGETGQPTVTAGRRRVRVLPRQ